MKIIDVAKSHKLASTLIAVMVGVLGVSFYLPSETVEPIEKPKTVEIKKDQEPKVIEKPEPVEEIEPVEVVEVEIKQEPTQPTVEPGSLKPEDTSMVLFQYISSNFDRWLSLDSIGVLNMITHHLNLSEAVYTEQELSSMANKCIGFIETNKQAYIDKYGKDAATAMRVDMFQTPCWLL